MVLIFILDLILELMDLRYTQFTGLVSSVIFATRANIDYYKKMVLEDNGWWWTEYRRSEILSKLKLSVIDTLWNLIGWLSATTNSSNLFPSLSCGTVKTWRNKTSLIAEYRWKPRNDIDVQK